MRRNIYFIALQRRLSSQGKSSATIHESMSLLDVLGKGRYGVVRLGQNKVIEFGMRDG